MASTALESANDHLLLHAVKIAHRHRGRMALGDWAARHRVCNLRFLDFRIPRLHRNPGDEITQLTNVARPCVREARGNCIGRERTARTLELEEVLSQRDDVLRALAQRRQAKLKLPEA